MAYKRVDRARMSVSAGGTGNLTLGSASSGFQTFANAGIADGDTLMYLIVDGTAWELGLGTYTASGTVLARTTRRASSTGSALNVTTSATVSVVFMAEDLTKKPSRTFAGTSDTLVLADAGGVVRSTGASAATVTVPPNSSVAYPVDTFIDLEQYGAGQVSVAPGSGVTLLSYLDQRKIVGQYGGAVLHKIATDEWMLFGSLAP